MANRPATRQAVWPIERPLNPSLLKRYKDCPRRLLYQDIERRSAPYLPSLSMDLGLVAHRLLAEAARAIRDGQPLLTDDQLYSESFRRMKKRWFPSRETHESHAEDVVSWVKFGVSYIDRQAQFLAIEGEASRAFAWDPTRRLLMETRADLVLQRADAEGRPFLEIIDYKTGSKDYPDEIAPVAMAFSFMPGFRKLFGYPLSVPIQFTYVWLKHHDTLVIDMSRDYFYATWESVLQLVGNLVAERDWPEQPSNLCRYCKYNGNACTAFANWSEQPHRFREEAGRYE